MTAVLGSFCCITDLFCHKQTAIQVRRQQAVKQGIFAIHHGILVITKMRQIVGNKMLQRQQGIAASSCLAEICNMPDVLGKLASDQFNHIQINLIKLKS